MPKISELNLLESLSATIPEETETVFIMSRIWTFAHQIDISCKNVAAWLFDLIDEFIGPNRTLIYPAFTFSYGSTRKFDLIRTKPETGVLCEIAFTMPSFIRTRAPMASYLVRGPKCDEVLALPCTTTCGQEGLLGWFHSNNTRICAIGLEESNMGWCMVHYSEETALVPYRYYKRLPGEFYIDGKEAGICADIHYVNPWNIKLQQDNSPLNAELASRDLIKKPPIASVPIRSIAARDAVKVANELLNSDPFSFILNKTDAKQWIKTEKELEIASLKDEERWV